MAIVAQQKQISCNVFNVSCSQVYFDTVILRNNFLLTDSLLRVLIPFS